MEQNRTIYVTLEDPSKKEFTIEYNNLDGALISNVIPFVPIKGEKGDKGDPAEQGIFGDGINKITVSNTQPVNPNIGDLWVDTN